MLARCGCRRRLSRTSRLGRLSGWRRRRLVGLGDRVRFGRRWRCRRGLMRGEEKTATNQQKGNDDDIPLAQLGAASLQHDWLPGISNRAYPAPEAALRTSATLVIVSVTPLKCAAFRPVGLTYVKTMSAKRTRAAKYPCR